LVKDQNNSFFYFDFFNVNNNYIDSINAIKYEIQYNELKNYYFGELLSLKNENIFNKKLNNNEQDYLYLVTPQFTNKELQFATNYYLNEHLELPNYISKYYQSLQVTRLLKNLYYRDSQPKYTINLINNFVGRGLFKIFNKDQHKIEKKLFLTNSSSYINNFRQLLIAEQPLNRQNRFKIFFDNSFLTDSQNFETSSKDKFLS